MLKNNMDVAPGCPKFMKNGPCGGYKKGMCEVYSDKRCIFVAVWEKSPDVLKKEI